MEKIEKPRGLIRYATGNSLKGIKSKFLTPRVAIYSVMLVLAVVLLAINISRREDIVVTILRGKDTPYQVIKGDGDDREIINHFKIHLKNQTFDDVSLKMVVPETWKEKEVEVISQADTINLGAGKDFTTHFFVKFPGEITESTGTQTIKLSFVSTGKDEIKFEKDLKLVGPKSF
jgi:polyferredoxin